MTPAVEYFHVVLLLVALSTFEQWNVDGAKGSLLIYYLRSCNLGSGLL